jgi:glycosyltransferase involved in cell wall biosynthesis
MLADKIKNLLFNKEEYHRISQEVRENVKDLSWENAADQFINLCKSCSTEGELIA